MDSVTATYIAALRRTFSEKHKAAEGAAYELYLALPAGKDRNTAQWIYENVRDSARVVV